MRLHRHVVPDYAAHDLDVLLHVAVRREYALVDLALPAYLAVRHHNAEREDDAPVHEDVVVDTGPVDQGAPPQEDVVPHVSGPDYPHALLGHYVPSQYHGALNARVLDLHFLSFPLDDLEAGVYHIERPADVHPHALQALPVERDALLQQCGEYVLREVEHLPLRDVVQHLWLEYVDPSVHEIGEHLVPLRLLLEPDYPVLIVELHYPELGRVLHFRQSHRRDGALLLVVVIELLHVDVREHVAARNDERVVEEVRDHLHGTSGARRVLLEGVEYPRLVVHAVPDLLDEVVRHVAGRDDYLLEAGLDEGPYHVVDARSSSNRYEGLRPRIRERSQPLSDSPRQHDRLHVLTSRPFPSGAGSPGP